MLLRKTYLTFATLIATFIGAVGASAQVIEDGIHSAKPGQLGFMEPESPIMEDLIAFHDLLMIIITVITIFVIMVLSLIWESSRLNSSRHTQSQMRSSA